MLLKTKKYLLLFVVLISIFIVSTGFRNDYFEISKQIEIFTTLYKTLNANYVDEINPGEIMNKAIKNTLKELDPYTVFFNEQDVIRFKINGTGEYTGIGAAMKRIDGKLIVREPYQNYAADKAGLKAGDEIISVNNIKLIDFKEDASELFKGAINTEKTIVYKRQNKTYTTTLRLEEVTIKAVPFYKKLDANTGYIVLSKFNNKASKEVKEAFTELKKEGITQLVLDLRNNPGGLMMEAINIVNFFVPKGELIVSTKAKKEEHTQTFHTQYEPIDTEIPIAVLINERSASASEIVSGALQDLDRAVIIGNRSFGKGLVQRPINLVYDTQLKVTISKYYTPSGRCIQALDYSNKNEEGKATKKKKEEYNAFTTKNGRTVYDGGGIQPDITIDATTQQPLVKLLLEEDIIFDYATELFYQNEKLPSINSINFESFIEFCQSKELKLPSDKTLDKALATAKTENGNKKTLLYYQDLIKQLKQEKLSLLKENKNQVTALLYEELIKRYQYSQGLYEYAVENNPEIIEAVNVLNTPSEYQKIIIK